MGQATVDELAEVLELNSVTVRHHLDILRSEGLIADPVVRHRNKPGRPQYVYGLSEKASTRFPKNYCELAAKLLEEVKSNAAPGSVNVIFEGVANRLSATAPKLRRRRTDGAAVGSSSDLPKRPGLRSRLGAISRRLSAAYLQLPLRGDWPKITRSCAIWT